jgi:hypothetical protein
MIGAYHISTTPIYRLFVRGPVKYARNSRTYQSYPLPEFIDVFVLLRPFAQQVQYRPAKYKKECYTIPVKISVYPFQRQFHRDQN